ncbi:gatB [Acrasis kona]|uniref:GatB n=1 Tax=Acrasis kona TaxID=1008807 RepID=A0AAW2YJ79_9EUKA
MLRSALCSRNLILRTLPLRFTRSIPKTSITRSYARKDRRSKTVQNEKASIGNIEDLSWGFILWEFTKVVFQIIGLILAFPFLLIGFFFKFKSFQRQLGTVVKQMNEGVLKVIIQRSTPLDQLIVAIEATPRHSIDYLRLMGLRAFTRHPIIEATIDKYIQNNNEDFEEATSALKVSEWYNTLRSKMQELLNKQKPGFNLDDMEIYVSNEDVSNNIEREGDEFYNTLRFTVLLKNKNDNENEEFVVFDIVLEGSKDGEYLPYRLDQIKIIDNDGQLLLDIDNIDSKMVEDESYEKEVIEDAVFTEK